MKNILICLLVIICSCSGLKESERQWQMISYLTLTAKIDSCLTIDGRIPVTFYIHNRNSMGVCIFTRSLVLIDLHDQMCDVPVRTVFYFSDPPAPDDSEFVCIAPGSTISVNKMWDNSDYLGSFKDGLTYYQKVIYGGFPKNFIPNDSTIWKPFDGPWLMYKLCK